MKKKTSYTLLVKATNAMNATNAAIMPQGEDTIRSNLETFFGECGGVNNVRIPTDRETGDIKARAEP